MISYEKMSKKAQKEFNRRKRGYWYRKPTTQVVPNKKAYRRQENKRVEREGRGEY